MRGTRAIALAAALATAGAGTLAGPAAAGCRLALVLGLDVSSSVNEREYAIQLGGLAEALTVPEVREVILAVPTSPVAVMAFEWSGEAHQSVIAEWTLLTDEAAIDGFVARLLAHGRSASTLPTAVGRALEFAAQQFERGPACARRTIDLSGDGENNDGPGPERIRATGLLDGITINGLVIQGAYPNPAIFYRSEVMQGPDAFVALARDFDDYPAVIIGKLLREMGAEMIVGEAQ